MTLNKHDKKELLQVYETWWHSYLNGDVKTYDSYLADHYRFIGSTINEDYLNKTDTTKFFEDTAEQLAGKAELRNLERTMEVIEKDLVLFTDLANAYVLSNTGWVFYSRFRFTSLMKKTKDGWRFTYQHFSAPDNKAQEGETLGTRQITKENEELRDAIKRRTIELEYKTRELEIEASLERIRNRTLLMKDSTELNEAAAVFFQQLQTLNLLPSGARTYFCHINPETAVAEVWMTNANGSVMQSSHQTPLTNSPSLVTYFEAWKRKEPVNVRIYTDESLNVYLQFISSLPHVKVDKDYQQLLSSPPGKIVMTDANFLQGTIGVMTFEPLSREALDIMIRFAKVFEFTYTRFLDLQKTEAQAREARIEVALEKIRSRSLGMHHSVEIKDVVCILFEKLKELDLVFDGGAAIHLFTENSRNAVIWVASPLTEPICVNLPYDENAFDDNPIIMDVWHAKETGEHIYNKFYSFEEKNRYFNYVFKHNDFITLPKPAREFLLQADSYTASFIAEKNSLLGANSWTRQLFSDNDFEVLKRVARVFEQAYIRFLDLQKAEAQAREAQIEAALERVRSRTMAMQKSEELKEVIQVVYNQFVHLNILVEHAGFIMDYKAREDMNIWLADQHIVPFQVTIPYFDSAHWNSFNEAKEKGIDFFANHLTFDEKNKFYQDLFSLIPGVPEETREYYFSCPGLAISTVLLENLGLYIENFSGTPYTDEENATLMRFGKVFQQTFTRFLDLQKAEAQARESQIELSLERVRARTMAMQHSEELSKTASEMFMQIQSLGMHPWACGFNIFDKDEKAVTQWMSLADGGISPAFRTPLTEDPFFINIYKARQQKDELLVMESSGKELEETYRYMFSLPGSKEIFGDLEDSGFEMPKFQITHCAYFSQGYLVFITYEQVSESWDIFKRFAKVFEQTYTRFLDLQKAEAQAREAKIEAALERVRSRTMAMQKSDELDETNMLILRQLESLDIPLSGTGIHICNADKPESEAWMWDPFTGEMPKVTYNHTHDRLSAKIYEGWKKGETLYVEEVRGEKLKEHLEYISTLLPDPATYEDPMPEYVFHIVYFKYGFIVLATPDHRPTEHSVFIRFAKVFEQTFTRFLDVQKAEAQAREAQIEIALERVRSRTMAMHKSDELREVVAVVFDQMQKLGFNLNLCNIILFDKNTLEADYWVSFNEQAILPQHYHIPYTEHPFYQYQLNEWKKAESFSVFELGGELKQSWDEILFTQTDIKKLPVSIGEEMKELEKIILSSVATKHGLLQAIGLESLSSDDASILNRFASVFEQTYTRFLDLQKAEAQAREAQIEAALERVRARALAMQKSNDLFAVAEVLWEQLQKLGQAELESSIIHIYNDDQHTFDAWYTYCPPGHSRNEMIMGFAKVSGNSTAWAKEVISKYQSPETEYTISASGEKLTEWYRELDKLAPATIDYDGNGNIIVPDILFYHFSKFSGGALLMISIKEPSPEATDLHKRAATVFDLAYKRFEDLQKAEAQAREAQIEAALEKVRGKAMAMSDSKGLSSTIVLAFSELKKLGIRPLRFGVGLINKELHKAQLYSATSSADGDGLALTGWIIFKGHPVFENIYDYWIRNEDYFPVLEDEQLKSYYELLSAGLSVPKMPDWQHGEKQYGNFFPLPVSCLYAWANQPFNETDIRILKRFSSIVELTFRRYLELQKSEANTKEAIKQSALDRVRAEIASMRTVADLNRITPLIWKELTIIGVPFIRCGVFIMDDLAQVIHTFLSTPDGKAIAAFHLPYNSPGNISDVLSHWQRKEIYINHWNENDFRQFADTLVQQGNIVSSAQYLTTIPQGGFYLHFLPFLQGMLYAGNTTHLSDDEIRLLQSVADAFSTAYARYEDFNKLETAKQTVEKTLFDLKQTQAQLVQSEKMASLGELTAGIAHEIQNP
ncbi:MAG: nuclear transport factor 2 family protein [Chitinophagaceae bacterium]